MTDAWFCDVVNNVDLIPIVRSDMNDADPSTAAPLFEANDTGEPLGSDQVPQRILGQEVRTDAA